MLRCAAKRGELRSCVNLIERAGTFERQLHRSCTPVLLLGRSAFTLSFFSSARTDIRNSIFNSLWRWHWAPHSGHTHCLPPARCAAKTFALLNSYVLCTNFCIHACWIGNCRQNGQADHLAKHLRALSPFRRDPHLEDLFEGSRLFCPKSCQALGLHDLGQVRYGG